jgi:hypothetical protein
MNTKNEQISGLKNRGLATLREYWVENLVCRRCEKDGVAVLSTEDRFSWDVQVQSVPKGFRAVLSEYGVNFHCDSCDSPAEL